MWCGNDKDKCAGTAVTGDSAGTLEKMRIGGALLRGVGYSVANYRMSFKTNNSVSYMNSALLSFRQIYRRDQELLPKGKKIAFFLAHFYFFHSRKKFPQSDMTPPEMNTAAVSGLLILNT